MGATLGLYPATYANGGAQSMVMPFGMPATGRAEQSEEEPSSESYEPIWDNPFLASAETPLSTFAIDVDTASYSIVRRFFAAGSLPPRDAVRIEELINYFTFDDPAPEDDQPFAVALQAMPAPWQPEHLLLRVGLKAKAVDMGDRAPANLVFLIDVSGSMQSTNKLPLVKSAMKMLADQLGENDTVAIAVYAGSSGLVLPPTAAYDKTAIVTAIDALEAGGSTHGSEGIRLAYETARSAFIDGGVNRVVLATDGDFNVGITQPDDLENLIASEAADGVFLTVLGFGMGNLKDDKLERLADRGNGNYAYVDTPLEARKVLVEEVGGTLVTVAKDVKVQIEFNPSQVRGYRLIGYENRLLAPQDFNDDTKDAGDIGAGHSVTALYELVPAGIEMPAQPQPPATPEPPMPDPSSVASPTPGSDEAVAGDPVTQLDIDPLRYGEGATDDVARELLVLKLRHKAADGETSARMEFPAVLAAGSTETEGAGAIVIDPTVPSNDLLFSASVAAFGMLLRDSPHRGGATFDSVLELAHAGLGDDVRGLRAAFIEQVTTAAKIEEQ